MTTEFRVSGRDGRLGAVDDGVAEVAVVVDGFEVVGATVEAVWLLVGDVDNAVPDKLVDG